MNLFDWKKFRNSYIFITHNLPETATKRYKFSLLRVVGYVLIYTFFSWMLLILILGVTPLKDFLFVLDEKEFKVQAVKVEELQQKVAILTNQLQSVASTNQRMKLAMKLAQGDSIDTTNVIYDSLKKPIEKKLKIGGSILDAFLILKAKLFPDTSTSNLMFQSPANGVITQQFNPSNGHLGIDFGMKSGSPVFASAGGLVVFSDYTINNGNMIILQHDNNFVTIYQHCSSLLVKARDIVNQGELIALSGNSGKNTTGPHLHFEIWKDGSPIDPEKFLIK